MQSMWKGRPNGKHNDTHWSKSYHQQYLPFLWYVWKNLQDQRRIKKAQKKTSLKCGLTINCPKMCVWCHKILVFAFMTVKLNRHRHQYFQIFGKFSDFWRKNLIFGKFSYLWKIVRFSENFQIFKKFQIYRKFSDFRKDKTMTFREHPQKVTLKTCDLRLDTWDTVYISDNCEQQY